MQRIMFLLVLCFFAVACGHRKDAKSFEKALEAGTGQQFEIAKLNTEKGKFVVYRNMTTGEYIAVDMNKWDRQTMTTLEQFRAAGAVDGVDIISSLQRREEWIDSGYWRDVYETEYDWFYDSVCDCDVWDSYEVYVGQEYIDTSHWYTFYTGGGFRFDNTSAQSRDLETMAALREEVAEKMMAHKLKSEFSLSATRATELAKLANRYQKLENARELTSSEKDRFAMDALGVSMTQVEGALRSRAQGSEQNYSALLETAARVNNTTPEQIGRFFTEMAIDQI